ncbi:class I SAM-dependent methyltransferase [Ramlibacter ginsenosidimutans]|uniref:Class I SAM-dependent methyltransferase n=1 Tax=Ramlibacter ginsenosidimutans TaxID=502333 RepID=A0A934WNS0_9BURK|nr:class I SAM-dependent methyltransferase [Ramlibacter ginsenosidimutans]MBK6007562.1 class I SAM-dependent methyltransferase [Ramlibacter ginsenosidimutans]
MSAALATEAAAWRRLLDGASAPYRSAGRFAWHFARGKLGYDPVFRHLLATGLVAPQARVLDIGCGQGLLASLLRACAALRAAGDWPAGWPAAPAGARITGIERMPRDVQRARAALAEDGGMRFVCGDMRTEAFPESDTVVILDVLHYVTHAEQEAVLARVRDALVPGGHLLLRVGDAGSRRGFAISQWVDRAVTRLRGHTVPPVYGRTLAEWIAQLRQLGLQVESRPMSAGTPFANVLLVAQRT